MKSIVAGRSRDRRRRWSLALAYAVVLASCDSPFAPERQDVERLDVNPAVLTLVVGGNATLSARVYGPNDLLLPGAKVFWSTQDPTVVTVSQDGLVNAVAAGTAQIAASSGGQSRTIAVTVAQKPIALVRISPAAATVVTGQTFQLQGEALDGDGNVLPNRALEWSSTQPAVATVNSAGLVTGVAVGQTTISAIGEGRVGTSLITVTPAPVATITIQPNGGSVPAGGTLTFTATARDAGGQVLAGRPITWRSSNDAVATVSAAGLMTAISPGVATITASAPNAGPNGTTPTASVNVTVLIEPVASAVIVPSPASVQVGQVLNLSVNLFDSGGDPLSAAGRAIAWSSSNPPVATVNTSGAATGIAVGNATITATITTPGQAGSVQATVQLSVSNQPVTSVVVTPTTGFVHAGYVRQFVATALGAQAQPLPGRQIIWTSSDQGVATVDAQTGAVMGINPGTVQIRATADGVQGVANITVDLVSVSSVSITPLVATLMPGQTVQLTAVARDSANNPITGVALGGRGTAWNSVNSAVAAISISGLVTAVAQGSSTVTATIGGTAGQSQVTVSPLPTASQLAITTQPSNSAPNDAPFTAQPVVQLRDSNGNNVATAGVVITAAITAPGTGTLGGTVSAITNAAGAATFTNLKITGTIGARTLTFTSGALTPATSAGINVTPGAATQLVLVTPPPSTAVSGQAFSSPSVVQLQDISGNNVPQPGVLVTTSVSPTGGVTLGGGSVPTSATGAATFGALTLTGPAGPYTLTFASGSLAPASSGAIALSAGSGSKLAITTPPPSQAQNGVAFGPVVIQLQDASGNPVQQAGVDVLVAIASGGGTIGVTTTVTTNSSGTATFSSLTITGTVGPRTLLFFASGFTSVPSGAINLIAGPPAALVIATPPSSSAQSGAALGSQPAIQVRDASGNPVLQSGIVVTATLVGPGGSLLPGTNTATTDGTGLAVFSGLGISGTAGNSFTLTFSTGSLSIGSSAISLSAGAASQLTITTQPAGAASGTAFTTQPVIQVRDAQMNAVNQPGITVTASIASGPGGTTLLGGSATTNGSGQAIFAGLGLSGSVGTYTITFASAPLTSVTSGSINLTHGAAAQLTIQTQPAGAASGAAFTTQPVILVRDAQNNPVSGITVSATPSAGATLVGSANSLASDAAGLATFSGLGLSGLVGNYTIDFSASGVPNVTSGSIALGAGAAAKLAMAGQPPSSVANGATFSAAVQLQDAAGNAVGTNGVPVNVALVGSGANLNPLTPVTTTGGVATFTGLAITGLVGNYSLSFSSPPLNPTSSGAIALTPGAAAALVITAQPPASVGSGATFSAAVKLQDASTNGIPGVGITAGLNGSGTLAGGSATTDASGGATFSGLSINATAAGTFTITFTGASVTSAPSSNINVSLPATQLGMASQPSATSASGATFGAQPSVQLLDVNNAPVSQAGVTINVGITGSGATLLGTASATTDGSGLATFSGLGMTGLVNTYTLTFTSGSLTSVQSSGIALTAGTASQLVMSSQPPASVASGAAFSAAVQVQDAAGNPVSVDGTPISIALSGAGATLNPTTPVNTVSGIATFSGLAITGLVGNYSLDFSASGLTPTSSSTIAVTPGAAAALVITAQPPASVASGATFSAAVMLQDASTNGIPGAGITAGLNGSGTLAGGSATTDASGVATFSGLSINATAAGTFTLTFTGASVTSAPSSNIDVSLPATQLGMASQPSATSASGATFGAQPSVQLLDVNNAPVSQAGVTINVGITGGGATLLGTASATTDASGLATFSGLGITGVVNTYTLTFTSGSLTSVQSSGIALTHGAATQLVFSPAPPSSATSGGALASHGVQLKDAQGNDVLTAGIGVTVSVAPGGASLTGNSASTDASGLATFGGLTITGGSSPPSYTLTYSATGVPGTVQAVITLAFFDLDASPDVTEVTIANRGDRGAGLSHVSILPDEWSMADVGTLRGTPTSPANTQNVASRTYLTITRADRDQLRFGAIRRGTIVSNPFGAHS